MKYNKIGVAGLVFTLAIVGSFGLAGQVRADDDDNERGDTWEQKWEKKWERKSEKKNPGNSAWRRSHKSRGAGAVYWGGQYQDFDALIARLEVLLALMRERQGQGAGAAELEVATRAASALDEDGATLEGEVGLNGEDTARVWFEYGRSANSLTKRTAPMVVDDDEDDIITFERAVSGLEEDTAYYFRAVAQDQEGRRDFGQKLSFTTDDDDASGDEPTGTTREATSTQETSATLRGEVDMNDFEDGVVFFVYGESRSAVEDVADDFDAYDDIEESGDALRKVLVDGDLDGVDDYTEEVDDLDQNTTHYVAIAVAYKDEDGDERIKLGTVRSFTTD